MSTAIKVYEVSLEAQRYRLVKEAKHHVIAIVETFEDAGYSGNNAAGRSASTEMLCRIENGNEDKADYVLVFKLSCFGYNVADVLSSGQLMQDFGVKLLSVEDGIDSAGSAGKLMINVLSSVSEIESENIRVQTMSRRVQKARDGRWNGVSLHTATV